LNAILHFIRFFIGLDEPESQVTDAELAMLLKYAKGSQVAVELGCYEGRTAVAVAQVVHGQVYSIDPFFKGRLGISYGKQIANIHAARQRINNIKLIDKLSWEAIKSFHQPIDFLFIDADHSYEAVRQDWFDWSPKIKVGGYVALHDSKKSVNSPRELGTMQFYKQDIPAVRDFVEIDSVDSLVVLRKVS